MDNSAPIETSRQSRTEKHDLRGIGIFVAGVLMMLLAAAMAFPMLTAPIRTHLSARTVTKVLPGTQFLSDTLGQTAVYTERDGSYAPLPSTGIIVSSVLASGGNATTIVRGGDGKYHVNTNGDEVFVSAAPLVGIDRSTDGKYLVYAEQATTSQPASITGSSIQFLTLSPHEWNVWMHEISTGNRLLIGSGVHPFFIGNRYVVRVAPFGIIMTDLATRKDVQVMNKVFARVSITSLVSPDHTLMGVSEVSSSAVTMYHVSPSGIEQAGAVPLVPKFTSYALGNDGLYTLRIGMTGTEVWHQPLKDGGRESIVLTLPEALRITRFTLSQ